MTLCHYIKYLYNTNCVSLMQIFTKSRIDFIYNSSNKRHPINTVSPLETTQTKSKSKLSKMKTFDGESVEITEMPNIPNEELNYRKTKTKIKGLNRIYSYFSAPVVKFLTHFVRLR